MVAIVHSPPGADSTRHSRRHLAATAQLVDVDSSAWNGPACIRYATQTRGVAGQEALVASPPVHVVDSASMAAPSCQVGKGVSAPRRWNGDQ